MFGKCSKCSSRLLAAGTTGPGGSVKAYFVPFVTTRQKLSTDGVPICHYCTTDAAHHMEHMEPSGCHILLSPTFPGNIFFCLETTSFQNHAGFAG
jgi:hypothetical protein